MSVVYGVHGVLYARDGSGFAWLQQGVFAPPPPARSPVTGVVAFAEIEEEPQSFLAGSLVSPPVIVHARAVDYVFIQPEPEEIAASYLRGSFVNTGSKSIT